MGDDIRGIGIALATYNAERELPALLESITTQEFAPAELVVCDDRSLDGTVSVIERFGSLAPFPVRLHVNEWNRGLTPTVEKALELCRADVIALSSQHDIWLPKKLLRTHEMFEAEPDLGTVFGDAELVDEHLAPLGLTFWEATGSTTSKRATEARDVLPTLAMRPFVLGGTIAFRSDLRDVILPMPAGSSHETWIPLVTLALRPYRMTDDPLVLHRAAGDERVERRAAISPSDRARRSWRSRMHQPLLKLSPRQADLHRQRRRAQVLVLDEVVERYRSAGTNYLARSGLAPLPLIDDVLRDLNERASHLRVRGTIPDRRIRRFTPILKELQKGRYQRYSDGIWSALQDLVT